MDTSQENIIVRIPGKLYAQAFQEKWLPSLSFFVYLSKSHSGKNYYFRKNEKTKLIKSLSEKHNIGITQISKHLRILSDHGLIKFYENEMRLIKNRDLIPARCKYIFVPKNISSYKDIKIFLNAIPIISNIVNQEKAIKRIKRYNYISEQANKNSQSLKWKDHKNLSDYKKKGGKMSFNSQTTLSIKRISELIERSSKSIVIKYKKFLQEKGLMNITNEFVRAFSGKICQRIFFMMKINGDFPTNFFWYKGYVYENRPSMFQVNYR